MSLAEDEAERLPILNAQRRSTLAAETKVYSRRWFILVVFCLIAFTQAATWNTWGPITESAETLFGWDDGDIGMFNNYANIAFIVSILPLSWVLDVKGMRVAALICACCMILGTGIRCISMDHTIAIWTCSACAVLNGVAACLPNAGAALLSATWFPPRQRATATAIMTATQYFGLAASFIIGPQLVRSPISTNQTTPHNGSGEAMVMAGEEFHAGNHINVTNRQELKEDIHYLLYIHGGLAAMVFVLVLVYFPSQPPTPPSRSAAVERIHYAKGVRKLLGNGNVWLLFLAAAIPTGMLAVWAGVLDVNLKPRDISQKTAGYLGFWQTVAGCITAIVISRCSDVFLGHMKMFLITLCVGALASCVWFTVLCERYIPFNTPSLYVSCILIGTCVNGAIPLFYETVCEASFPVAEGITLGLLTLLMNVVGIAFLFLLLIKSIGTVWMNWALLGSTAIALPLLGLYRERYTRTHLDLTVNVGPPPGGSKSGEDTDK